MKIKRCFPPAVRERPGISASSSGVGAVLEAARLGLIEIRSNGEVWKSVLRNRFGIIRQITPKRAEYLCKDGRLRVAVFIDGRRYAATSHRIVWESLFGPIPEGLEINHKDGVGANNHPDNLEVVTHSENMKHAWATGLVPGKNNKGKFSKTELLERAAARKERA